MNTLLWRASARFYLGHPWQLLLAIIGVALGVGVFIGVDVANGSALRAFDLTSNFVRGTTTHRILPVGDALPESLYRALVVDRGIEAAPIIETDIAIDDVGAGYTLLGIDPLRASRFRTGATFQVASPNAFTRLLTDPGTVLAPDNLRIGDRDTNLTLRFDARGSGAIAVVAGTLPSDSTGGTAILTDISSAQELTNAVGELSRIDLILSAREAAELATVLPNDVVLVVAGSETTSFDQLSSAFKTNIQALGLLALVVGMFMIYSTVAFTVVRRRSTFGVLRALGLTRGGLATMLLAEAAVLALCGTGLGIVFGDVLAHALLDMVTATIGDFAFGTAVKTTAVSPWLYTKGALLGIGTTIIAALGPLREATRIDPASAMLRSNLERRTRGAMKGAVLIALLLTLVGVALLVVATTSLWIAFGALFLILFAAALATPSAVAWLAHLAEPLLRIALRSTGALAARNASAQQSRIAVASASLTLAVAAVIGIGLMVSSFRDSLTAWLGTTLTADVYVTTTGENLPPITLETARADSDVTSLSTTRFAALPTEFGTLRVRAYTPSARGWGLDIVDGDVSQVQRLLEAGGHVAVAEPFAYRNSLRRGDTLNLPTANGKRAFEIAGIYRDYNTGGASVLMSGAAYREHWGDGSVSGIGLDLVSGADAGAVSERLRVATGPQNLRITTTEGIKAISQNVFDRTFRITEVLRLLAAVVAFLGILSALMSIQFEREHEFNVLRAIGFSPRRLAALIMTETSLVGTAAGIAAIPTGIGLAALLVYVINRRSFGWTMELTLHPAPIVSGFALAAAAAVLAGIVPSLNGYRRGAGQTMTK